MEFREHHREVVSLVCDLLSDTILKLPVGTLGCAAHCIQALTAHVDPAYVEL
jgi:hypothetical protein